MRNYSTSPREGASLEPLTIQAQGSFAIGGVVVRSPGAYDSAGSGSSGQTLHGDHAHVMYQVPVGARKHPLVFVHGNQQFARTWQSTPDGREGFQNIFLRRGFPIYLLDQPRRGGAGRSSVSFSISATPEDQTWFDRFRVGTWPEYFPGVQFPQDAQSLDQFFRQITPDTGPFDVQVSSDAVAALFDKIGPGILVSHSQGGGVGWFTALKSANVRGIVAYEPGSNFPFPEGEVPESMPSAGVPFHAVGVPLADFKRLISIPIIIYYGDYIPRQPTPMQGLDNWRVRRDMAELWAQAARRHGGDVTVVTLPDIGIHGNTHFPFSDLNNIEVADEMSRFLASKGLDAS